MTDFRSLPWFSNLDTAIAEARRTARPILSLCLLGNLFDELTCANSRFFKRVLYAEPRVHQVLRQDFVLHWQSVRPVPLVTIDFGDGRRLSRTLTGNSAHLVLDPHGRVVDALPGLFDPDTFLALLAQARAFARADRRALARLHAGAAIGGAPPAAPSRAMAASMLAMSKHRVELPVLRQVEPLPQTPAGIAEDTAQNRALHRRIHEAFAARGEWAGIGGFVEWLYADIFLMPLHDPALGLDVPDPFGEVDHAHSASSQASTSPRLTTPARSNSAISAMPARAAIATSR